MEYPTTIKVNSIIYTVYSLWYDHKRIALAKVLVSSYLLVTWSTTFSNLHSLVHHGIGLSYNHIKDLMIYNIIF